MAEPPSAFFDDCLTWQGEVSVALAVRSLVAADLRRGERLLADLAVAEQPTTGREPDDDDRLRRLEAKVDLLALLLARHLGPLPGFQTVPATLSARGAAVPLRVDPEATALGLLLADWMPEPLWLPGRVLAYADDGCTFAFDPLPGRLADLWEALVFRWHRRALAESRRGTA